jgi:hypothetical protein
MKFSIYRIAFLISCTFGLILSFSPDALSLEWLEYSTKGNPKANGLHLSVKYPSYFIVEEYNVPKLMQSFSFYNENSDISGSFDFSIEYNNLINNVDFSKFSDLDIDIFVKNLYYGNGKIDECIEKEKIIHKGKYGIKTTCLLDRDTFNIKHIAITKNITFYYNNNIIFLSCTLTALNRDKNNLTKYFNNTWNHLCTQYLDSLNFHDKF